MTKNEARSDAQELTAEEREAAHALARGECPDGGGPHCVCSKLGRPGQCVSLASLRPCTTCDDDGRFRIGTFTDTCGDCLGSKYNDGRFLRALAEVRS